MNNKKMKKVFLKADEFRTALETVERKSIIMSNNNDLDYLELWEVFMEVHRKMEKLISRMKKEAKTSKEKKRLMKKLMKYMMEES